MIFPFGGYGLREEPKPLLPEAKMLKDMLLESKMDLASLLVNIAKYAQAEGKHAPDLFTIFDPEAQKLDLAPSGAANASDFEEEKMGEIASLHATILRDWLPNHLTQSQVGIVLNLNGKIKAGPGPLPWWFMPFMKQEAWRHLAILRRKQRAEERKQD